MPVIVSHPPLGSASTETRHEAATAIEVEEGHLELRTGVGEADSAVVAVYAPGSWASATVEVLAAPPTAAS